MNENDLNFGGMQTHRDITRDHNVHAVKMEAIIEFLYDTRQLKA